MARRHPDATFTCDFGEVFAYDESHAESPDLADDIDHAIADGVASGRGCGTAGDVVVLFFPEKDSLDVTSRVVVHDAEPPLDLTDADVCVDFDLRLPTGRLAFEAPTNERVLIASVQAGRYRVRWSGTGFAELQASRADSGPAARNPDRYRLDLWPSLRPQPAVAHRTSPFLGT